MSAASGRPKIQPEPCLGLGGQSQWLGLLLVFLSVLDISGTEVQQAPTLQGKGYLRQKREQRCCL